MLFYGPEPGVSKKSPLHRVLYESRNEDETFTVEAVSGSVMMIRRAVLEQIGLLDEGFFAYQEDTDFCFRVRQAGWQVVYFPKAQVVHFGGEGGSRVDLFRSITEWHRSYFRYYRKNLARDYFFLFNWLYYLLMGGKLVVALGLAALRLRKVAGTPKP